MIFKLSAAQRKNPHEAGGFSLYQKYTGYPSIFYFDVRTDHDGAGCA
jgi:hypothetical protein